MNKKVNSDKDTTSFLSELQELLVFISIYIIFIGWMYKYYFVQGFGVSTHEVELSTSDYMIYAYSVFIDHWILMSALLLVISAIIYKNAIKNVYIKLTVVVICFPVFWYFAESTASKSVTLI